ncbi:YihY/virulence factor BrkB family protein [Microbacterium marinilacus]|uniref:YihY/virulence factor BrkB family protein n=1 Tax=Microbacterium marinilacus TaxID=415209 RepID=A0ABP7B4X4_9MICO|nr:YihY/virulence factor BrkB family protein [Microbacterium marinilacus]MBY0687777.1 YihY/virulence factor BrkB family protein [Microbacterium marinilacus]
MAKLMAQVKVLIAWALARKPVRAFLLYSEQKGALLASAITYRALFSIFAAVLLGFSVAAVWLAGRPELIQAILDAVDNVIPGLVGEGGLIDTDALLEPASFTVAGIISLVGLLVAAIGAVGALREAIRIMADNTHAAANGLVLMLRDLLFAVILGALLLAAAATTFLGSAFVSTVLGWIGASESGFAEVLTRAVAVLVTLALDAVFIALMFRMLSGLRPSARALWSGSFLGSVGLVVLQQLSGLFVGGATSNPLLATFGSLVALLLWVNLSAQVLLISSAYIVTGIEEDHDRVGERYGAETFAQRRVRRAESSVQSAVEELRHARDAEEKERTADLQQVRESRE